MTEEKLQQLWKNYQDAWADISTDERERLLRASVTEDVIFTSPGANGRGFGDLLTHIAEFQQQFPGASFRSNQLLEQNNQLFSEWTLSDRGGSPLLTGHSYAQFDDGGHLTKLAGFWKQ